MSKFELLDKIFLDIKYINNFNFIEYFTNSNNENDLSTIFQAELIEAKKKFNKFVEEFSNRANLYTLNSLEIIANETNKLAELIESKINNPIGTQFSLSLLIKAFENTMYLYQKEYDENIILDKESIISIMKDLNSSTKNLNLNYKVIESSNDIDQSIMIDISKNLIKYYNLLLAPSEFVDFAKLANTRSYLNQLLLLVEGKNQVNELHELTEQVNENISKENTSSLQNGYEIEAKNIKNEIKDLYQYIILIFMFILFILFIKLSFIIYYQPKTINIYTNLAFFIFVIAISTLLGYLIKERKRLIELHDQYKSISLRLESLPSYMRELDNEQRQKMYVNLSKVFFEYKPEAATKIESEDVKTLTSINSELVKLISVLKTKN